MKKERRRKLICLMTLNELMKWAEKEGKDKRVAEATVKERKGFICCTSFYGEILALNEFLCCR